MKSLLLKDFYNLRKSTLVIIIIDLIYSVIFIPSSGPAVYTAVSITMFSAVGITSFNYDEATDWDTFALATPISRKDLLLSKFVVLGTYILLGLGIGVLTSSVYWMISGMNTPIGEYLLSCMLFICFSLDVGSLYIYVITRFGVHTSKVLILGFYIIPFFIMYLIVEVMGYFNIPISESQVELFLYAQPLLTLVIVGLTFLASYRLILKKDY